MIEFPEKTLFNRVIPKTKFYENLPVTPAVKGIFVNEIASIVWRNKLSPETLNVQAGSRIREIEVIEITLKKGELTESVLRIIDRGIPYHLLFLLRREDRYMASMSYKELTAEQKGFRMAGEYFGTDWMAFDELPLRIDGVTMDAVHDHFIQQISGTLTIPEGETLKSAIDIAKEQERLQRRIAQLESRLAQEKQFNRQLAINDEIKRLKASANDTDFSDGVMK